MKPVLFHSINLLQQEEREKKKSVWLMIQWISFFASDDLQESAALYCLVGRANARVRLNGRKRSRSGSLQRVLNSEVGDLSSLQSLRFNCSECSWRRVTAYTDWQHGRFTGRRRRWLKWRPGQKMLWDNRTCLWNTSRLSLTVSRLLLTVKCHHYY